MERILRILLTPLYAIVEMVKAVKTMRKNRWREERSGTETRERPHFATEQQRGRWIAKSLHRAGRRHGFRIWLCRHDESFGYLIRTVSTRGRKENHVNIIVNGSRKGKEIWVIPVSLPLSGSGEYFTIHQAPIAVKEAIRFLDWQVE